MNNKEMIAQLSQRTGYKTDEAQHMVTSLLGAMGDAFSDGDVVALSGFGAFEVKKKLERIMVNPATGGRMLVPPKLVLGFKPNPSVKEMIKTGE